MTTHNTPTSSPAEQGPTSDQEENNLPEQPFIVPIKPDEPVPEEPEPSADHQPSPEEPAAPLPWFTWFLGLLAATILFWCGISLWDTLNGLWERSAVLATAGLVLTGLLVLVTTAVAIQEWQAMQRINTLEEIRQQAERSLAPAGRDVGDLTSAREAINGLVAIYSSRDDTREGSRRLAKARDQIGAASGLIIRAETEILKGLDDRAEKVIRDTALRVATETALMPWSLADVLLVFLSSMQMFRRIAEIYGSRPGVVASWTLSRKVLVQLTTAGVLSAISEWVKKVSTAMVGGLAQPIVEGITNGYLMARTGTAAMELCRPLPFHSCKRPSANILNWIKTSILGKS